MWNPLKKPAPIKIEEKKFDVMEYLKKNPLTDEQLFSIVVDRLSPNLESFSAEEEQKITEELAGVEGYTEYLAALMNNDVKRHFKATTPVEQVNVRGAFGRTLYLRARAIKARRHQENKKEVNIPKLSKRSGNVAV